MKNFFLWIKEVLWNVMFPISSSFLNDLENFKKSANDLINVQKRYIIETEKNHKNMISMLRYVCRSSAGHIRQRKPIDEALKILDLAGEVNNVNEVSSMLEVEEAVKKFLEGKNNV
jgi:hypothetical protein